MIHSYGSHELQKIKVFKQVPTTKRTIVFIHGGGWRDPVNTYDDFKPIMSEFGEINLISINYRLSPKVQDYDKLPVSEKFYHPFHLIDVANALSFIVDQLKLDIILIVGHSVGAALTLQLTNFKQIVESGLKHIENEVSYTNSLKQGELDNIVTQLLKIVVSKLFFVDGIYDVEQLLNEYGSENLPFISCAFKNPQHYQEAFITSNDSIEKPIGLINETTGFSIIHSLEDELLSTNQSKLLKEYFDNHGIKSELLTGNWGKHEEVYTRRELAQIIIKQLNL